MSEPTSGRVQPCEHSRVTWWPNGQECDTCGEVVRVSSLCPYCGLPLDVGVGDCFGGHVLTAPASTPTPDATP